MVISLGENQCFVMRQSYKREWLIVMRVNITIKVPHNVISVDAL